MKVSYLGPRGSFSYKAALAGFPKGDLVAKQTIIEVIADVEVGSTDFALIPIENAIEGTVNQSIDYLFHRSKLSVVAEIVLPIAQSLMAADADTAVEQIYSHPQALAQTAQYLRAHYPQATLELSDSTTGAARFVAENPNLPLAAVASKEAATIYNLTLLAENIQDVDDNYTRFWVLGAASQTLPLKVIQQKMSLAVTLPNNLPGALHKSISVFAWRNIGMTKIESRPLRTTLGEYFFIIDLEADPKIPYALEEMKLLGAEVRILGEYTVYAHTEA